MTFANGATLHAVRRAAAWASLCALLVFALAGAARAAEAGPGMPLRVAVYDVEPYGAQTHDGLFSGASVDLWRRVAEDRNWQYRLTLVSRMDDLLSGLQENAYDVAIGAITITPERLARVDFSYPTHRSGVAAVFAKQTGASSALYEYGAALGELGPLLLATMVFLAGTGILMWWFERSPMRNPDKPDSHSSVTSWHDGVYWAVVTMTTVGYGDKTPKTHAGRAIAMVWMIGSLVLVSLLTTTLIARITVNRVEGAAVSHARDLTGKRLAAVGGSSGAEYLDAQHVAYEKFGNLPQALGALAAGKTDAVVNSVGALQYLVRTRFAETIAPPRGQLAPAYMAFALPMNSGLKKSLDRALTTVTTSPEWRSIEEAYFGQ
ncbi:MAG TPA: transporter substrate-binding domain-containing protein [Xanthobacteraceae bacterium]